MTSNHPEVLVFDVNETLSDLTSLQDRFADVGAPTDLLSVWFAGILRDGFALTAAGGYAAFADLARDGLRALISSREHTLRARSVDEAADHIVEGFAALPLHPDVPDGIRALHDAGIRLVTMTNGSTSVTEALLDRAGLRDYFELLLDVTGPRRWKPAAAAYHYAVDRVGVPLGDAMLVAVHPWDVDGAVRAGLSAAWVRRGTNHSAYPSAMTPATLVVDDLAELASRLAPPGNTGSHGFFDAFGYEPPVDGVGGEEAGDHG